MLKGEFDMLWPTISQQVYSNRFLFQQMQPVFIIFEGLNANSNYTLLIHLKKTPIPTSKHNLNQISQVQLVLNRTLSTLSSTKDADANKSHRANNELDYYDDEDEYYLEDQSEEDYTEMSSYSEPNKRNERIVSCDLSRTSISTSSEISADASSGSSPNSLFNLNGNKRKVKNQFITINYSSNGMNKLVLSVLNTSANLAADSQSLSKQQQLALNEMSSNVSNFKDFFDVKQFGKDSLDYSVYYDCLKQYNVNSKQINFILTRPLCLFSLAPTWRSLSDDDDGVARNEDFFSVQTTITVPSSKIDLIRLGSQGTSLDSKQHAFIVASSCHKKRYTNRNIQSLVSDDAMQIFPSKKAQSKHQSFKKQDLEASKNGSSQFSNLVLNESNQASQNKSVEMLPFILSTTTLSSLLSSIKQQIKKQSSLMSDSLSINDCLFISDNELQFRIDHDLIGNSSGSKQVKAMPISNKSAYAYPIIYEIEVTLPVNAKNLKTSQRTVLNHQPSYVNFNLRKENNSQVVLLLFFDVYLGEY